MIIISNDSSEFFKKIAECAYEILQLIGDAEVEFVTVSEDEIKELNFKTRGIDKATDVLSYPNLNKIFPFTPENYPYDYNIETKSVFLGSIVICEQIAMRQAQEYGHSFEREKGYLFLHGLLHLLGYDHIKDDDKKIMRQKEEEILSKLGVKR